MKRWAAFLYKAWIAFGTCLGRVVNPVVLTAIYIVAILPVALAMKLLRYDPMRRRFDPAADSYWIARHTTSSMKDMF